MKKVFIYFFSVIFMIIIFGLGILNIIKVDNVMQENIPNEHPSNNLELPIVMETKIKINAIGDCTIGYDDNFGYQNSFNYYYDNFGEDHFFKGVKDIFLEDDFTFANLETTFTDANIKTPKKFNFKGPKEYVHILNNSSIEVVNIANNHIKDYGDAGYTDTIETLENAKINFLGYDYYYIFTKNDIKIGLGGIHCIENKNCTSKIDKIINDLKAKEVDDIILSFHWGIEKDYKQSAIQTYLAHYAIDNGVLLVLGHHPHVLQGIEEYQGKYIVYSLANFSFGGNKNPKDKDTMIFQIEYTYEDKEIKDTKVNIIPTSVSSKTNTNDYSPTILIGEDKFRVLEKIQKNSINFNVYEHSL